MYRAITEQTIRDIARRVYKEMQANGELPSNTNSNSSSSSNNQNNQSGSNQNANS